MYGKKKFLHILKYKPFLQSTKIVIIDKLVSKFSKTVNSFKGYFIIKVPTDNTMLIRHRGKIEEIFTTYEIYMVVNFAAESHVYISIVDPEKFSLLIKWELKCY